MAAQQQKGDGVVDTAKEAPDIMALIQILTNNLLHDFSQVPIRPTTSIPSSTLGRDPGR